jgi:hypothetical protein
MQHLTQLNSETCVSLMNMDHSTGLFAMEAQVESQETARQFSCEHINIGTVSLSLPFRLPPTCVQSRVSLPFVVQWTLTVRILLEA